MSVWLSDCLSPEELLLRFLLLWFLTTSSTCPSTGSATATTTASWLSSSQPIPSSTQGYELHLMDWIKASSLKATNLIARCASVPTLGQVDDLMSVDTEDHLLLTRQLDNEFQLLVGWMHQLDSHITLDLGNLSAEEIATQEIEAQQVERSN